MGHVYLLLSNDREIFNYTTAASKYWLRKKACFYGKNCTAQGTGVFRAVHAEML
jgi:hypothetical protein